MTWHQNIFNELKFVLKYSTLVFTYLHTHTYQCLCVIGLDFLGVILISFIL